VEHQNNCHVEREKAEQNGRIAAVGRQLSADSATFVAAPAPHPELTVETVVVAAQTIARFPPRALS